MLDDVANCMRDIQERCSRGAHRRDSRIALGLKQCIPYCKRLVDDQDIWAERRGGSKGDAHLHSTGIGADRLIKVLAYVSEDLNILDLCLDIGTLVPLETANMQNVLSSSQLGIESHSEFQDGMNPPRATDGPFGRAQRSSYHLEQRTFPRSVSANNPQRFAAPHFKTHIAQNPLLVHLLRL